MFNCASKAAITCVESGKPTLFYFGIAARGELAKLVAAVGGVELDLEVLAFDLKNPEADYKKKAAELGFPGCGLPLLTHGSLTLSQSSAIQDYLVTIGPNYPAVNASQQAIDNMFSGFYEDSIVAGAKVVFGGEPATFPVAMDKIFGILDGHVPESGFIHGFDTPSKGDLCVMAMTQGTMPWGAATAASQYDYASKFPKLKTLSDAVASFPAVAEFLKSEKCKLFDKP